MLQYSVSRLPICTVATAVKAMCQCCDPFKTITPILQFTYTSSTCVTKRYHLVVSFYGISALFSPWPPRQLCLEEIALLRDDDHNLVLEYTIFVHTQLTFTFLVIFVYIHRKIHGSMQSCSQQQYNFCPPDSRQYHPRKQTHLQNLHMKKHTHTHTHTLLNNTHR